MRQLSPALAQQCAAYEAGENQHPHYAPFHGYGGDPALGTGAFRAETVGTVAAFQVIVEVVDEVGCDLHAAGKQCAQQRRYQVGLAVGKASAEPINTGMIAPVRVLGRAASTHAWNELVVIAFMLDF